jgi:hypothetical protein
MGWSLTIWLFAGFRKSLATPKSPLANNVHSPKVKDVRSTSYPGPEVHDSMTRNHQCRSMWQLLKKVRHFMETVGILPLSRHGLTKL